MRSTQDLIAQWRVAEQIAATAESVLLAQCVAYAQGKGRAPTGDDWEKVAALRLHARELFGEIMLSVSQPGRAPGGEGASRCTEGPDEQRTRIHSRPIPPVAHPSRWACPPFL